MGMTMDHDSTNVTPPLRLSCRIDATDVEDMLDTYDSGMCDISTANCISRAIARRLSCDRGIRLIRHNKYRAELEIRGRRIPISVELLNWLVAAETGVPVDPIEIVLDLPRTGPTASAVVRMATAPTVEPPTTFASSRTPVSTRPIAQVTGPRWGMEVPHPKVAARANLLHMNEGCRSGLKTKHEMEGGGSLV
jgi:hypothetical protein